MQDWITKIKEYKINHHSEKYQAGTFTVQKKSDYFLLINVLSLITLGISLLLELIHINNPFNMLGYVVFIGACFISLVYHRRGQLDKAINVYLSGYVGILFIAEIVANLSTQGDLSQYRVLILDMTMIAGFVLISLVATRRYQVRIIFVSSIFITSLDSMIIYYRADGSKPRGDIATDLIYYLLIILGGCIIAMGQFNMNDEAIKIVSDQNLHITRSIRQLETILDNIADAVIVIDAAGNIVNMNPAALRLFGRSDLLMERNLRELLDNHIINSTSTSNLFEGGNPLEKALQGERITNVEFQLTRKGSHISRTVNFTSSSVFSEQNQLDMIILTLRDITEKVIQNRLLDDHQKLALTAEREKNEALQKAMDMKDEFLSLISHEFRTPLNVIHCAVQSIDFFCRNELSPRAEGLLRTIRQNTFRQMRLVNNLLDITRISTGNVSLHENQVDIVFLTKAIIESVRTYAEHKRLALNFVTSMEQRLVGLDDEKYERILLNLLSNAIKFSPEGKEISVTLRSTKHHLSIEVRDQGMGIPEDKLSYIFERFGQVDNSLSRQAEGSGIGLSLVKKFVEAMGGSIAAKSTVGKGSTFGILLPDKRPMERAYGKPQFDFLDNRLIQTTTVEFSDVYL